MSATHDARGEDQVSPNSELDFVVYKHDANRLHYELRMEVDGVMKSWTIPRGPSFDPKIKRLAFEGEEYPIASQKFAGTIPESENGDASVTLWDEGTYTIDDSIPGVNPKYLMETRLQQGMLSISFHGQRLRGSFLLFRTRDNEQGKSQWLFVKQWDAFADSNHEPVGSDTLSERSHREMTAMVSPKGTDLRPMLMTTAKDLPIGTDWVYEQKFDGVRVLAMVDPEAVALISRLGKDKSRQFPEFIEPLQELSQSLHSPLILDGEITAVDAKGHPLSFHAMMDRIHLDDEEAVQEEIRATPLVFFVFDLLLKDNKNLQDDPWYHRRQLLEEVMAHNKNASMRLVPTYSDPKQAKKLSEQEHWEGVIAKDRHSGYDPGIRSRSWWKWRTLQRAEFIIGGWTEPKGSRDPIGSLLLGYFDEQHRLQYAGYAGSGFTKKNLAEVYRVLVGREQIRSPFATPVATNNRAHWVKPEVVAEIQFKEWTADHHLGQGVFLGLRNQSSPL